MTSILSLVLRKKIVRTTTENGSNFIKAFRESREQQQPPVRLKRMLAVMMVNRKSKVLMLTSLR